MSKIHVENKTCRKKKPFSSRFYGLLQVLLFRQLWKTTKHDAIPILITIMQHFRICSNTAVWRMNRRYLLSGKPVVHHWQFLFPTDNFKVGFKTRFC